MEEFKLAKIATKSNKVGIELKKEEQVLLMLGDIKYIIKEIERILNETKHKQTGEKHG